MVKKNKPIRCAIIGMGEWGKQYVKKIKNNIDYELVIVCDRDEKILKWANKNYNVQTTSEPKEVYEDSTIEAVFILTPNYLHVQMAVSAINAGKHVYIEKPLTTSLEETKDISLLCTNNKDICCYVAHSLKKAKVFEELKKVVESGVLGEVKMYSANRSLYRIVKSEDEWRINPKISPLLPMLQLGVHMVDIAIWLFGKGEVVSACQTKYRDIPKVAQSVIATIRHNDIIGNIQCSYSTQNTMNFNVYGTRGIAKIDGKVLTLEYDKKKKRIVDRSIRDNLVDLELKEFARWIRYNEIPCNTYLNGIEVVEVFEEIKNKVYAVTKY